MFRREPLSSTYMLVSLIGFVMSALMLEVLPSWAFAFMIVFIVMFIASIVSMSNVAHDDLEALDELSIHDPEHYAKKRRKYKK